MNRFFKIIPSLLILAAALMIGAYGCGGGGGTEPGYDVRANLNMGWQYFADDDYDSAVAKFTEVMDYVTDSAEALRGRGWTRAFLGQLSAAAADLELSLEFRENKDARMGLASVYRDIPDLMQAISNASDVIDADSLYVFSKRTSIDYRDARLIKAQCYYRLGSSYFEQARSEVNYLCSKLSLTLLPEIGSVEPAEFEVLLVDKIEQLTGLISD
jgi:tetratricopeptide (TPR) repeat protein